ncbi:hypothetical protein [Luteimonas sp. YGD11-2]|nr:hypothetical protein [Luteimonas sp. YGD11-2]
MSLILLMVLACLLVLGNRVVHAQQRIAAALESIAVQLERRPD